ncbi:unnamed protein product [Clonostachys byssicola]|uniref:Tyrosinase copper-binding domain-containing protein n=1 Tax=Clonostachys byssicola TaxID=160290 RepID=A0A9N9UA16_9HYPO|nr:unnamed protein product [Clonostachys byssicola]
MKPSTFSILAGVVSIATTANGAQNDAESVWNEAQLSYEKFTEEFLVNATASNGSCNKGNVRTRQRWDDLSTDAKLEYIRAVKCLYSLPSTTDPLVAPGAKTRVDDFVYTHINQTNFVHGSGIFLPWHREYMWLYESALYDECGFKGTGVPYWDWFLHTDDQASSPVFDSGPAGFGGNGLYIPHEASNDTLVDVPGPVWVDRDAGTGGGCVVDGAFANLTLTLGPVVPADTPADDPYGLKGNPRCLKRDFLQAQSSAHLTFQQAADLLETTTYAEFRPEVSSLPLYGVPFAVKDNIDAEGFATTAVCPSSPSGKAASDAVVVRNFKSAAAILIGKTNLDQFATGLVGTRSPYGAVPNSFDLTRVSGGSSSGSAVVVARGVVPFSLGTDTAGSGRVPAGFNDIIGSKPTRGALSTTGVVPACRTLDCVSIFALTVEDAQLALSVVEGYDPEDSCSRKRPDLFHEQGDTVFGHVGSVSSPRLAICSNPNWFGCDGHHPAYDKALEKAASLGWILEPIDFSLLFQLAQLLYSGTWVAERYEAIRSFIRTVDPQAMDPVVHKIIKGAEKFTAADAFAGEYLRRDLTRQIETAFASFDGILVPTTPTFPTLEQLSLQPVEENSKLGTYTSFVNFMDWSALSFPAGFRPDGLPFGLTLIANAWQEPQLLELAHRFC